MVFQVDSAAPIRTERDGSTVLHVPGLSPGGPAGAPQLPLISTLVAAPPAARVSIAVESDGVHLLPHAAVLAPVPQPQRTGAALQAGQFVSLPDPTIYGHEAFYPETLARIASDGWLRDQRLLRVEVSPVQYNPVTGRVQWHSRLRVTVSFAGGTTAALAAPADPAPLAAALSSHILNAEQATAWRSLPAALAQDDAPPLLPTTAPLWRIAVDADGLYELDYADLQAAGLPLDTFDPRTLVLLNQGRSVALQVVGEDDGRFDAGDRLRFYGQRFRGSLMEEKYTSINVYWLTTTAAAAPRMAVQDGTPDTTLPVTTTATATVRAERSVLWWPAHFTNDETWFWQRIQYTGNEDASATFSIGLPAVASAPVTATVRGEVVSRAFDALAVPNYRTRVALNNALVADDAWGFGNASERHRFTGTLPQSTLQTGTNQLQLTALTEGAGVTFPDLMFDWFEVDYLRDLTADDGLLEFAASGAAQYRVTGFLSPAVAVLDVSDPAAPHVIEQVQTTLGTAGYEARFRVTSATTTRLLTVASTAIRTPTIERYEPPDLLADSNGADYVLIGHASLLAEAERLAAHRRAEGLRVAVVDVADLYNLFNNGIYHPVAIKRFLAYTLAHWQAPAPLYVVLLGDGHWNLLNHAPATYGDDPILMPPNLAWVDPWQGETDSANQLVTLVGDDALPDMMIGRIPVNTPAELAQVIDKIIIYEQQGPQPWHQNITMVADNVPDTAGDFVQTTENLLERYVPDHITTRRLYLNGYCGPPASGMNACPPLNNAIATTLNTSGTLFLGYNGHATIERWAGENIWNLNDVATLDNTARLPIVLGMTCLDGILALPRPPRHGRDDAACCGWGG
ncbi:MAG: hypothetical protein HC876_20045 [Chloroflexaceae bacterium]|nr:hypothetical protein [Chloroflexaceae bacterium]